MISLVKYVWSKSSRFIVQHHDWLYRTTVLTRGNQPICHVQSDATTQCAHDKKPWRLEPLYTQTTQNVRHQLHNDNYNKQGPPIPVTSAIQILYAEYSFQAYTQVVTSYVAHCRTYGIQYSNAPPQWDYRSVSHIAYSKQTPPILGWRKYAMGNSVLEAMIPSLI